MNSVFICWVTGDFLQITSFYKFGTVFEYLPMYINQLIFSNPAFNKESQCV